MPHGGSRACVVAEEGWIINCCQELLHRERLMERCVHTHRDGEVARREVVVSEGSRDRNDGKVGVSVTSHAWVAFDQSEPASIPKQLRFAKTSYMPPMPPPPGI